MASYFIPAMVTLLLERPQLMGKNPREFLVRASIVLLVVLWLLAAINGVVRSRANHAAARHGKTP